MNALSEGMKKGIALSMGIKKAKDLGNLPGNICTPNYLADQAKELAKKYKTIRTKVMNEKEIEGLGMGAFMSVTKVATSQASLLLFPIKEQRKRIHCMRWSGKALLLTLEEYL